MSDTESESNKQLPNLQSSNPNSSASRLIDLSTGEISSGDFDSLLDPVFGVATAARSAERFSDARPPLVRDVPHTGLYSEPYLAGGGRGIAVAVYADLVKGRKKTWTGAIFAVGRAVRRDGRGVATAWDEGTGESLSEKRYFSALDAEKVGGSRGQIVGFDRRCRKRMIETMAKIRNEDGGHFVTLTCSDNTWATFAPDDQVSMAAFLKTKLHALEKRLMRAFPSVGGIWRLEFKVRKSGVLIDVAVPHLHLIVFGTSSVKVALLQRWFSKAWYEVVGSRDPKHLRAGTNCRTLESRRHAANYVSKYVAKEEDDQYAAGRRWATFGALDLSSVVEVTLSIDEWVAFKRLVRGWLRGRRSRFVRRFAATPKDVGATVLGLGDQSLVTEGSLSPTIFRMLQAVSKRGAIVIARGTVQA